MNFQQFSDAVYEDLNGQLLGITVQGEDLLLDYECDDWDQPDSRLRARLRCLEVKAQNLDSGYCDSLRLYSDHPLLLEYNDASGALYFRAAPANAYEVIGRLYEAHAQVMGNWQAFGEALNDWLKPLPLLKGGHGLLARGPLPLLQAYASALDGLLPTNIVCTLAAAATPWQVLLVEARGHVICRDVQLEKLDRPA